MTAEQRDQALTRANEIRAARAHIKADLKAHRTTLRALLLDPPACFATCDVYRFLTAAPRVGRSRAMAALNSASVSPQRAVGALTERQRKVLAQAFRDTMPADENRPRTVVTGRGLT